MKLRKPKLWIAILSALAVAYFVLGDLARTAPGPLSSVHAREPELSGWRSCSQCHGGLLGNMTTSCLACHEEIDEQIEKSRGLHGSLNKAGDQTLARRCERCHSEHHGADFAMVNRSSFAQAGVPLISNFDHEIVGYEMSGKHLELHCTRCHSYAEAKVLPEGVGRFLGLQQDCLNCHADPHEGRMNRVCSDCHTQNGFDEPRALEHSKQLPLSGAHKNASCRDCHAQGGEHALEAYAARIKPRARTCTDCHEDVHSKAFVLGNAKLQHKSPAKSCANCHEPEHMSFAEARLSISRDQHAQSGFHLEGPHAQLSCEHCHDSQQETFARRYSGRSQDSCEGCHQDPHAAQFQGSPVASKGCLSCHERTRFRPSTFDLERHNASAMPLSGRHRDTDCNACHLKSPGKARQYHAIAGRCQDCHADAHEGFFAGFEKILSVHRAGTCATCHSTQNFQEASEQSFEHGRWTGFELEGAHAQERCEACHQRSKDVDALGRRFGRCSQVFGALENSGKNCIPCHQDPHAGQFDKPKLPQSVDGRKACARCHNATSFRVLDKSFEHQEWTGFALRGRHKSLDCGACHLSGPFPTPGSATGAAGGTAARSWGKTKGSDCADCHMDPHQGQFAEPGNPAQAAQSNCARCHRQALQFTELSFKHDLHSRFKLGEAHRALSCASCHRKEQQGTHEFVRYKPLDRNCSACHGTRGRPFQRKNGRRKKGKRG